jgi:regulator of protease activity HflC (stomatin/prohibitin superfamily)
MVDEVKPFTSRRRVRHSPILGGLVALIILLFLAPTSIVFIEAGHGGVVWRRFGGGTAFQPAIGEGYHLIWPWNRMAVYDLRLQTWEASLQALTSDGLDISLEMVMRFRLSPENLAFLHAAVGPEYVTRLVRPQVEAVVHELVALYPIEQVLGPLRTQIQRATLTALTDRLRLNSMGPIDPFTGADVRLLTPAPIAQDGPPRATAGGLVNTRVNSLNRPLLLVQDILISRIVMPPRVRAAIEEKLEQNQRAQAFVYRLQSERQEAERRVIEADGIRRAQEIVSRNLTPGFLTLRGIEATEALARSTNAKTLIIGGANGLPVILNAGDIGSPGGPAPNLRLEGRPMALPPQHGEEAPLPAAEIPGAPIWMPQRAP